MIIGQAGHEYDVFIEENNGAEVYKLHRSNGADWSPQVKGTVAMTLIDTGNDVKFFKEGETKESKITTLDYSQAVDLLLLLKINVTTNKHYVPYTIVPVEGVLQV